MIPAKLRQQVDSELGISLSSEKPLSGGSINQAAVAETGQGKVVLKWNSPQLSGMFETEAMGLKILSDAGSGLKVPEVIGTGKDESHSWILMEFIPPSRGGAETDRAFGSGLAALHRNTSSSFGLDHDNYIGRLPQSNSRKPDWLTFFMEERIMPQLKQAVDSGLLPSAESRVEEGLRKSAESLFPVEPASLLHGDLWSGNYLYTTGNQAAVIDPAVYYGNREIELAFTGLFGRFPGGFYEAYQESWPLEPGFDERKALYNLYPLLVHVNLFGHGYTGQAQSVINRYT